MALHHIRQPSSLLRASIRFAPSTRAPAARRFYPSDSAKTAADGASDKSKERAQPKILNKSPPKEGQEPEDVKKHNEEMANRADKPAEHVKEEDIQKDKVSKSFWKGQAGTSE